MADYTLSARGTYDGRDFDSGIDASSEKLEEFRGKCAATQVAIGNLLSGGVAAIGSAIKSSVDAAVGRVDTMNNFVNVMDNLGVSSDAAEKSIKTLSGDALKGLPTTLDAAVAGVQRLTSKNEDVEKSTDYFLAMNNAVVAGTNSAALQETAIEQLSQAYAKGKMDMQEWRAVQQAMPAQLSQVAKALGMTADELGDGLREGGVSMERFMETLVTLNKEGVEGLGTLEEQARASTGGIATQVTNLQTAVTRSVADVIDKFNETGAITKTIKMLTDAANVAGNTVVPIAAEVGERVSEAADTVGASLEPLARSLPEDGRAFALVLGELVSGVTSLVKVASPLLPTIAKVAPLVLAAHAASKSLAGELANLSSKVMPTLFQAGMNGSKAADALLSGMGKLSAFAGGPMVAAITAAVAVIGLLVVAYSDAKRSQAEYQNATTGLVEASRMLGESSGEAAGAIGSVGDAASASASGLDGYAMSVDELIRKQGELADSIRKSFADANDESATLRKYSETIEGLAGNCDGSSEKVAELEAAIKGYNDMAGTSIAITDSSSGAINISTEALRANTEAWEANAKAQAAQEMYQDAFKAELEAKRTLDAANEKLAASQRELNGATFDGATDMSQYTARVEEAEREVNKAQGAYDSAQKATRGMSDSMSEFAGDAARAKGALDELASSEEGLSDALSGTTAAIEEQAASVEGSAEALKMALDAQRKARQRAYDNAYKEQQRAYDSEHKAQQRALDAQYKEQQRAYDSEYKALQKRLTSKYNAVKKSLDAELDALEASNDAQLKSLKKGQEAQVKAFEKATDQRITLIDKEYNAKLKLLEAERDERVDAVDAQIAALEEQTKAEERTAKEAQRESKRAELQKAVDQARYASERAAAEKALSDYIAEIEQERAEERRKDAIEALKEKKDAIKEEISDRKEALQEERDARKEAVKESRSAELDAIKEANEAEYDALKASLDKREKALKRSQSDQLETLKQSQSGKLEALKQSQSDQLEALKRSQSDQLEALKQSQSDQLDAVRQSQSDALEALERSQKDQLAAFKEGRGKQAEESEGAAEDAKSAVQKASADIKSALDAARDPIGYACERIREKVQEKIGPVERDMEGFGSGGGGRFADAMANREGDVARAAGSLVSSAGGKFEEADATKAGENFASTFADGMGGVDIWSAAYNIGMSALDAIKSALGIHSPSREAMKLFRQFDRGAVAGIDDDAGLVAKSAVSMAQGALDAVGRMPSPSFGTIGFTGSVNATPGGGPRFEGANRSGGDAQRGGLAIYIGEMTVRNRSDADYFSEVLHDKWTREEAGTL